MLAQEIVDIDRLTRVRAAAAALQPEQDLETVLARGIGSPISLK